MKTDVIDRRRRSRVGLFGEIEDVTYRVLRRTESAGEAEGNELAGFVEGAVIPAVDMPLGLPECEPLGEPF